MNIEIFVKFDVTDLHGNIIKPGKFKRANSLVQAFAAWLATATSGSSTINVPDTSNTNRTMGSTYTHWNQGVGGDAAIGVTTHGILAGTGTNAVVITDYNLQALIAHGTGAGQLSYAAMVSSEGWAVSGSNSWSTRTRTLTNTSGGDITIKEVGYVSNVGSSTLGRFLMDRTLVDHTVVNGTGVIISYKWQVSV